MLIQQRLYGNRKESARMVVEEWVERPVIVEYISGPAFDYSDPPKIVQGPISARTGRFILKAYDERGVRIARFPAE